MAVVPLDRLHEGHIAYLGPPPRYAGDPEEGPSFWLPDVRIDEDDPSYVLHPMRGTSTSLAVFDGDDKCIGWMPVGVLGFDTVKEWIEATGYEWVPSMHDWRRS